MPVQLNQTKHFQISKTLAERIKYMLPGEPLPTVAELKAEFEASQVTISAALERLRRQGLVEIPEGRGRLVVAQASARTLFTVSFIRHLWFTPDYEAVFNAIYKAGHDRHWGFTVYTFADVGSLSMDRALADADAAIILGLGYASPPAHLIKSFNNSRKPIIFLRDKPENVQASLLWVDDREFGRLATHHLLELGHRRILCMLSEPQNPSSSLRMFGWRDALQKAGARDFDKLVVDCSVQHGEDAMEGSYQRLMMWLKAPHPKFTAIFCASWTGALGAMRALRECGLTIPGDVSLVTSGSEATFSDFINPPLTTVRVTAQEHAQETIRLVHQALNSEKSKTEKVLLQPTLHKRESTRAL